MPYRDYPPEKRLKEESSSEQEELDWDDEKHALPLETYTGNPYHYHHPSLSTTEYRSSSRTHYATSRPGRPLIDFVKNEWQTDPRYGQITPPYSPTWSEYEDFRFIQLRHAAQRPYFKRKLLGILLCALAFWTSYDLLLVPVLQSWGESSSIKESLNTRIRSGKGWFGMNMQPKFADIIQLETLDKSLIPGGEGNGRKHEREKRLIVVGDVHGCVDELTYLLAKVSFNKHHDHLVLTGDLVSKGPSSPAVVDLAISLNASCVRGNHEDRILLARRDLHNSKLALRGPTSISELESESFGDKHISKSESADHELAASLSDKQVAYLSACPLILLLGPIRGLAPQVSVVHAGLLPGVPLERQDPSAVMTMRSVDLDTYVPSPDAAPESLAKDKKEKEKKQKEKKQNERKSRQKEKDIVPVPWTKLWNEYQSLRPKAERQAVIYGHDSKRGLVLDKYSKGLDSGCARGGKLSALVIESERRWWKGNSGRVRTTIVSVGCQDYRDEEH
ncbi:MAG: hypothetical protein MMC33_004390 [Icmadophila ericetorum]|nr:hypothetical protein [Icmadophila ericetorum]